MKIIDELIFSGEIWYGKNLSDVRGGIDQGINTTRGNEIASRGGWAELVAQLADPYQVAAGVGVDDPRDSSLSVATQRSHNIAPYLWNKVDFGGGFAIGAEAIFWATDYLNVETGRANRYSLFVTWSFWRTPCLKGLLHHRDTKTTEEETAILQRKNPRVFSVISVPLW